MARLFVLKNVPYATLDAAIQQVVNKARGGGAVAMPGSNAVLVTDSLSNVRRIESIVSQIDVPSKVLFVPLKNTRARGRRGSSSTGRFRNSGLKTAFARATSGSRPAT